MTDYFNAWRNGIPVIALGDGLFAAWSNGVPFVDITESGEGPGPEPEPDTAGARIVSPRIPKRRAPTFSTTWYLRRTSPLLETDRVPS